MESLPLNIKSSLMSDGLLGTMLTTLHIEICFTDQNCLTKLGIGICNAH
jgi:hypothetical protein